MQRDIENSLFNLLYYNCSITSLIQSELESGVVSEKMLLSLTSSLLYWFCDINVDFYLSLATFLQFLDDRSFTVYEAPLPLVGLFVLHKGRINCQTIYMLKFSI